MTRRLAILIIALLCAVSLNAQSPKRVAVHAGKLIDGRSDRPISNALILIEDGKITSVTAGPAHTRPAPRRRHRR
jgi:imidazolonepropionase-like amidohydrolase